MVDRFLSFLANHPGDTYLSVFLLLILVVSLGLTIHRSKTRDHTYNFRLIIGLIILLIIRVGILWIDLIAGLKFLDLHWALPSVERAFTLLTLIWFAWLWIFPNPTTKGDRSAIFWSLFSIILLAASMISWWLRPAGTEFIYSFQDITWQVVTLVLIVVASITLLVHKPVQFQFGMTGLFLAGAGHLIYLLVPMPLKDYLGVLYLYQAIIFCFLILLPFRSSGKTTSIGKGNVKEMDLVGTAFLPTQVTSDTMLAETSEQVEKIDHEIRPSFEKEPLIRTMDSGSKSIKSDHLEQQLRLTLEELSFLQNELAEAKIKIDEYENKASSTPLISEEQVNLIASIAQELRQPLSSIVGYTDLIMGESVGILGALQRKFLERIKFSSDRTISLIEDLIQITSTETDRIITNPQVIDLNIIIDNAVAYTSAQLREKNITMRLDIPESPPKIHIDREALQQILIHLLQNAGAATLIEGTILLRVHIQTEEDKDFLLIQVVDSGGGIPSKDLPKVFVRRYRAENVLIQGLGDTGVGLSIAKTLAEAQSGRIWVETSLGVGSTISVLLPIVSAKSDEEQVSI
jgi:signal transduction histidine kinase